MDIIWRDTLFTEHLPDEMELQQQYDDDDDDVRKYERTP